MTSQNLTAQLDSERGDFADEGTQPSRLETDLSDLLPGVQHATSGEQPEDMQGPEVNAGLLSLPLGVADQFAFGETSSDQSDSPHGLINEGVNWLKVDARADAEGRGIMQSVEPVLEVLQDPESIVNPDASQGIIEDPVAIFDWYGDDFVDVA